MPEKFSFALRLEVFSDAKSGCIWRPQEWWAQELQKVLELLLMERELEEEQQREDGK